MIRLAGVHKALGGRVVLRELDLEVARGECVVISGPSGAGKSTLLRLVAGLAAPDHGTIWLDGREASVPGCLLPPHRRGLAVQFQDASLWPHMTLLQNVAFGLGGDGVRAARYLARAGLGTLGRRRPSDVSGGEARRAALARALAPGRGILLLDEPLASLPPDLQAEMTAWIGEELVAAHAACLWVAHDVREAAGVASRRLVLADGALRSG